MFTQFTSAFLFVSPRSLLRSTVLSRFGPIAIRRSTLHIRPLKLHKTLRSHCELFVHFIISSSLVCESAYVVLFMHPRNFNCAVGQLIFVLFCVSSCAINIPPRRSPRKRKSLPPGQSYVTAAVTIFPSAGGSQLNRVRYWSLHSPIPTRVFVLNVPSEFPPGPPPKRSMWSPKTLDISVTPHLADSLVLQWPLAQIAWGSCPSSEMLLSRAHHVTLVYIKSTHPPLIHFRVLFWRKTKRN